MEKKEVSYISEMTSDLAFNEILIKLAKIQKMANTKTKKWKNWKENFKSDEILVINKKKRTKKKSS